MPFHKPGTSEPPEIILEVVGPTKFRLLYGFVYVDKFKPFETVEVTPRETDLASVPFFLQWLVRSYGRHTMAALVHDHLWQLSTEMTPLRRANRLFRHAMWELSVAWIRRWLMWAAVTLGMFSRNWNGRVRLALWAVSLAASVSVIDVDHGRMLSWSTMWFVVAGAALAAGAFSVGWFARNRSELVSKIARGVVGASVGFAAFMVVVAIAAHLRLLNEHPWASLGVLSVIGLGVWGRSIGGGIIGTIAIAVLAVPIIAVFAGLAAYTILEIIAWGLLTAGRWGKKLFHKEPSGPLNPPTTNALFSTEMTDATE